MSGFDGTIYLRELFTTWESAYDEVRVGLTEQGAGRLREAGDRLRRDAEAMLTALAKEHDPEVRQRLGASFESVLKDRVIILKSAAAALAETATKRAWERTQEVLAGALVAVVRALIA